MPKPKNASKLFCFLDLKVPNCVDHISVLFVTEFGPGLGDVCFRRVVGGDKTDVVVVGSDPLSFFFVGESGEVNRVFEHFTDAGLKIEMTNFSHCSKNHDYYNYE